MSAHRERLAELDALTDQLDPLLRRMDATWRNTGLSDSGGRARSRAHARGSRTGGRVTPGPAASTSRTEPSGADAGPPPR